MCQGNSTPRVKKHERKIRNPMSRFSKEKVESFDTELRALVQRYLDMPDVDAMALGIVLGNKAHQMDVIGLHERQEFRRKRDEQAKAPTARGVETP